MIRVFYHWSAPIESDGHNNHKCPNNFNLLMINNDEYLEIHAEELV